MNPSRPRKLSLVAAIAAAVAAHVLPAAPARAEDGYEPPKREAPVTAEAGAWAGLGNGVEVAVLERLRADPIGGGTPEGWRVRIRNTADAPRPFPVDQLAFDHGGVTADASFGMNTTALQDAFERGVLPPSPGFEARVFRLAPGQEVEGWVFAAAPAGAADAEASLLVLKGETTLGVRTAGMLARLPVPAGFSTEPAAVTPPESNLASGETFEGGAVSWRPTGYDAREEQLGTETRTEVSVSFKLVNPIDREVKLVSSPPNLGSSLFLIDDAGRVYGVDGNRFEPRPPFKLQPGEETEVGVTFTLDPGASPARLVADGALGFKNRKEQKPLMQAAPIGVWPLD